MKWGLIRRGDYPEAIARELEHLAECVRKAFLVEHDTEGRQRAVCARWNLAATQTLTTATATRIVCTRTETDQRADGLDMGTDGILTVRRPGTYHVLAQVTFAADAAGARTVAIRRRQSELARSVGRGEAGTALSVQAHDVCLCDVGDTIEVYATQTVGAGLNVSATSGAVRQDTFLRVVRMP